MGLARCGKVATTSTGVRRPFKAMLDQLVALMAQELSVLLNFACYGESDLTSLGRFQVLGATCSGGGHLLTPG